MEKFVETNGIRLHYFDYPADGETLILLHGLTANAASFEGFIQAGLNQDLRLMSVDLRGRGLSSKPATGYSLEAHSQDILGLLDALALEQVILVGHSFGGRLAIYMAAHYPARVKKLVLLDIGFFHPQVYGLIMPSVQRLNQTFESWEAYLEKMRQAPAFHEGFWDAAMESYYRADVEVLADGTVKPRSELAHIMEVAQAADAQDWESLMQQVQQPAILLHAPDGFGTNGTPPILTEEGARRVAELMPHCEYKRMSGNHMTMLFGVHAEKFVAEIRAFVSKASAEV